MRGYAAIGLINTKTPANVGGAMRACSCFGASLIVVQGKRYQKEATDVGKTWRHIPVINTDNLWKMIPFDCIPIAVEIDERATNLTNFVHPERAFYIFGQEDGSIPKTIMNKCPVVVKIPSNFCLNLAATVNVVLYDRMSKRS